ncbi:hypothetical protein HU200_020968 [Digitaria exilis]|uniref:J domain-containing protein n=1 Tax=Digitaria exilis TaxID=1010633 RepID=A0A835EZK0_9POAL|nr:hypothetical protein HU200_020968 [Digitaria exilis]
MLEKDFVGAKRMIIKAQKLSKEVDDIDIPKMLTVCDVHCAAGVKVNAEIDWYGILQVPVGAEDAVIKKQYRKLALLLHPDKNKFGGAEAAFKLVGEANMTLTDQSKRQVYDMKRSTFRGGASRPPHQHLRKTAPARSNATPVNLHTQQPPPQPQQASNSAGPHPTFWTVCPSCGMRYQYYLSILNKALRCQNCLQPFMAHDLNGQAIPSEANQRSAGVWKNAGTPQSFPGPQTNVTGQKAWSTTPGVHVNIGSRRADANTKRKTDGDTDEYTVMDPEFFDFDQLRDVNQFRANQIWAIYDDQDCMPRFYARITKVKTTPKFMLHFVWLEFDPKNKAEEAWSCGGLPVACGRFKHGQSETTKENTMFSRTISFDKSKTRNSYEIYPRKGEVWALFKGWDSGWSSNADNHKNVNHQYEVVEVLSDFTTSTSIIVMPLVKIKGYVSLFVQSREAAPYVISQGETLRFSHCVPHHLMSGTEKEGIPEGSLELDPAALPLKLEEAFPSVSPECSSVRSQESDAKHAGLSSGNISHKGSMNAGEWQHTASMNVGITVKTPKKDNSNHDTNAAEVTDIDGEDICRTEYVCADSEFYNFSEIRFIQKFSPGQIWALYSDLDKFPNYYAYIQKVDLKNDKLQVRWLDVCPQGEEEKRLLQEERTIGCGTFRLSSIHQVMTYTGTDAFSHSVVARSTGRKYEYEIIPHLGEIWAVYKNWRAGWTAHDFENCEYELVEIFGHTDSSIQVQHLRKVDGYRTVFMPNRAVGSVKTIRKDEYPKFSHQIPCFHLTHEKGGKLHGYLELDPLSVPEEFLFTD